MKKLLIAEDDFDTIFKCSICLNLCKEPVSLPCTHFFCKTPCIDTLIRNNEFRCPECREHFSEYQIKPFALYQRITKHIMEVNPDKYLRKMNGTDKEFSEKPTVSSLKSDLHKPRTKPPNKVKSYTEKSNFCTNVFCKGSAVCNQVHAADMLVTNVPKGTDDSPNLGEKESHHSSNSSSNDSTSFNDIPATNLVCKVPLGWEKDAVTFEKNKADYLSDSYSKDSVTCNKKHMTDPMIHAPFNESWNSLHAGGGEKSFICSNSFSSRNTASDNINLKDHQREKSNISLSRGGTSNIYSDSYCEGPECMAHFKQGNAQSRQIDTDCVETLGKMWPSNEDSNRRK